jgi:hypothetical protein
LPQYGDAVGRGHHDVQDEQFRLPLAAYGVHLPQVRRLAHHAAARLCQGAQPTPVFQLVIDDQQPAILQLGQG